MSTPITEAATVLELAGRVRTVVTRLNRRLRREAEGGLSPTASLALASLRSHGPLSLGELAAEEGVKPPTMTATVQALEELGYVSRQSEPGDRRVSRIAITTRGRHELDRRRRQKTAYLAARLQHFASSELAQLQRTLELLEKLLEEGPR
ncbi:MAG: MarR family winged helix-turn-helix transcriptional regulator [Candidatus Dormibacter sp.]|uniref:MarR family winged helix-turn-helix transcriptional regulator n=1 Tax=Candidatus Dormibacter sp. TaxID=2973982 RepID=UPI0026BE3B93